MQTKDINVRLVIAGMLMLMLVCYLLASAFAPTTPVLGSTPDLRQTVQAITKSLNGLLAILLAVCGIFVMKQSTWALIGAVILNVTVLIMYLLASLANPLAMIMIPLPIVIIIILALGWKRIAPKPVAPTPVTQ